MRKEKSHSDYTLEQLATELTRLADLLVKGRVLIGASEVMVADPVSFKIKQKLKDDHVSFELSLTLPIKEHLDTTGRTAASSAASVPHDKTPARRLAVHSMQEADETAPKKDIARLWKTIHRHLAARTPPPADQMALLLAECSPAMYSGRPWHRPWTECCDLVTLCVQAAGAGDYDIALQLAAEVDERTHACHKQYK